MTLWSENVAKYEFLTGNGILPEKTLLEKAVTIKTFEYSKSGSELEKQIDIGKNNIKDRIVFMNLI